MVDKEPTGSFVRWQAVTIGQLTYAINLVLGFSVATLGFQVTLLLGEFTLSGWENFAFGLSLILLTVSIAFGIAVVINRLRAFRATMHAARAREKKDPESIIESHRQRYQKLDSRTWPIFWWQIGTFGGGIALAMLSLLAFASRKLL